MRTKRNVGQRFNEQVKEEAMNQYTAEHWLVNPFHVLHTDSGNIFINGTKITEVEREELRAQAKTLLELRVWKILQETLKQQAIDKSVLLSKTWEEVLAGKMMVHNLGIIRTVVELLAKD